MSREQTKNVSSFYWFLLLLYHQKYAFSVHCGSTKTLNVYEGKDAILQLGQTSITSVTWNFEKHLIAITKPGQPLALEKYSSDYTGRLSTLTDGSLRITQLTTKDRRVYRADLFNKDWGYLCSQLYDLRINEPRRMSPNIADVESCGSTDQLVGALGGGVTLQLPSRSDVAFIEWDINNIDHIAVTEQDRLLIIKNNSYAGRLSVTADRSLKILKLTTEDQRVYRAELFINYWVHECTQLYDLRVNRIQPLIPKPTAGKAMTLTTSNGTHIEASRNYTLQNTIRLVLSACIVVIVFCIVFHHIKTSK